MPPEANCWPSNDHLRPQTSCLWPESFEVVLGHARVALVDQPVGWHPLDSVCPDQHNVPTRAWWPPIVRVAAHLAASQICTSPTDVPTARCVPRCVHATDVTESSGPRSHSLVTLEVHALHS